MSNQHLINIILYDKPFYLCLAMALYKNLIATPVERRKKLLEMHMATTEFYHIDKVTKEREKGKEQGRKRFF